MATRCTIVVRVKPEDIGTTQKFDLALLPDGVNYSKDFISNIKEVTLKDYISVYTHWDGYPDGVGKVLISDYKDYKTALNLLLGGYISSLSRGGVSQYCAWRGEDWEHTKPLTSDELPGCEEAYIYLLDNDVWQVSSNKDYPTWKPLEELLKE